MITNLIIEISGDKDYLQDRVRAVEKFAKKNKTIKIFVVCSHEESHCVLKYLFNFKNTKIISTESNINKALTILNETENSVFVSAGDTVVIVKKAFRKIQTVYRKTVLILVNTFPKVQDHFVVADIGAALKPDLFWVALACRAVANAIYGKARIGMLNIGEEIYKEEKTVKDLNKELKKILGDEFVGNKEIHIAINDSV
mgnify:CR=1 FL=1